MERDESIFIQVKLVELKINYIRFFFSVVDIFSYDFQKGRYNFDIVCSFFRKLSFHHAILTLKVCSYHTLPFITLSILKNLEIALISIR